MAAPLPHIGPPDLGIGSAPPDLPDLGAALGGLPDKPLPAIRAGAGGPPGKLRLRGPKGGRGAYPSAERLLGMVRPGRRGANSAGAASVSVAPPAPRPAARRPIPISPRVQVIATPAAATPAPAVARRRRPNGRLAEPTAAEELAANLTYLGDRLGVLVNRLPTESRHKLRSAARAYVGELRRQYHGEGGGEGYLNRVRAAQAEGDFETEQRVYDADEVASHSSHAAPPKKTALDLEGDPNYVAKMGRLYGKRQPHEDKPS